MDAVNKCESPGLPCHPESGVRLGTCAAVGAYTYAAWKALMLAWFTADLQARIPDDFMPAEVVQGLDAQAPDGRRPTVLSRASCDECRWRVPLPWTSHLTRIGACVD